MTNTPEIISSWNRQIRTSDVPFSFSKEVNLEIPKDWDQIQGKYEPSHINVFVELTREAENVESFSMAQWADDRCIGMFAYRDYTQSSLPVVDKGDLYWSQFTFQKLSDAEHFVRSFNNMHMSTKIMGNWMEGYEEFCKECNTKRNA